jgi:hypothetical protein
VEYQKANIKRNAETGSTDRQAIVYHILLLATGFGICKMRQLCVLFSFLIMDIPKAETRRRQKH